MNNKMIAIVTGGSTGIGRVVCTNLHNAGYRVGINYWDKIPGMEESAKKLQRELDGSFILNGDVASEDDIEEMLEQVEDVEGTLNLLVNNAGITGEHQLLCDIEKENLENVLNVNLKGVVLFSKAFVEYLVTEDIEEGCIINISSITANCFSPGQIPYAASKAAIQSITRNIAGERGRDNIRCNCIAPGYIQTSMTDHLPEEYKNSVLSATPLGCFGKPEDIADAVLFLANAKYITGVTLPVNGGMDMGYYKPVS